MGKSSKKVSLQNGHIASNRAARHNYEILDKFEAGLVLLGSEVKSLRYGRAAIGDGYISITDDGEAWIENISIPPFERAATNKWVNHEDRRKRKLLLHRLEISRIQKGIQQKGFTAVPLALYFLRGRAKLEFGLARGKKLHDKREALKTKQVNRELAREVKLR
ncbi:MAG: SsrA-binding protein SmpB [Candidatus Ancillula sp.]|jgi:SsrA-binding protein|nr:SsrA-binding protein SmpB [Candidatus Ancillula sp.]